MKKKFEIFLKQMGGSPKRKGIFQLTRAGYAMRLEASTLAARRFAYPELGDAAPSARRAGERRAQRGLARARCAKSRRPER